MKANYKVILLPTAQKHLASLDKGLINKLGGKIGWLSKHPEILGQQPLTGLPPELKGLCKYRVGDYRIVYRVDHKQRIMKVYAVKHRSQVYKEIDKSIRHKTVRV